MTHTPTVPSMLMYGQILQNQQCASPTLCKAEGIVFAVSHQFRHGNKNGAVNVHLNHLQRFLQTMTKYVQRSWTQTIF